VHGPARQIMIQRDDAPARRRVAVLLASRIWPITLFAIGENLPTGEMLNRLAVAIHLILEYFFAACA